MCVCMCVRVCVRRGAILTHISRHAHTHHMTHTQRMLNGLRSAPVTLCRDNVEDVTFLVRAHLVVLAEMDHVTISAAKYDARVLLRLDLKRYREFATHQDHRC